MILSHRSSSVILRTLFTSNIANGAELNPAYGNGGGLYSIVDSNVIIIQSEFTLNRATYGRGGGLYSEYGSIMKNDTKFNMNTAQYGGALNLRSEKKSAIRNSSFFKNIANDGGGIFFRSIPPFNPIVLKDSIFVENSALGRGGAIFATNCLGGGIVTTMCFFHNCSADTGGTMLLENSNLILNAS